MDDNKCCNGTCLELQLNMLNNPEHVFLEKDDSENITILLENQILYYKNERSVYNNYLHTLGLVEEILNLMNIDQDVTSSEYELKMNSSQKQVHTPTYNCGWGDSESSVVPDFDTTVILTVKNEMKTEDNSGDNNSGDAVNDKTNDKAYVQKEFNDFSKIFLETSNNSSSQSTQPNKKVRKLPPKVTVSDNQDQKEDTTMKRTSVKSDKKRNKE